MPSANEVLVVDRFIPHDDFSTKTGAPHLEPLSKIDSGDENDHHGGNAERLPLTPTSEEAGLDSKVQENMQI